MEQKQDWQAWHQGYADAGSALSQRLRAVQGEIEAWLDSRAGEQLRVVSVCAGQGRDLIEVLVGRADSGRVGGVLVELDPGSVAVAEAAIAAAGLSLEVRQADAGQAAAYAGVVPADLVVLVGVLGNVSDEDVQRTIMALPGFCRPHATVIWTRHRREPDLTPQVREWLAEAGFTERAIVAPEQERFLIGRHELTGPTGELDPAATLFRFVR